MQDILAEPVSQFDCPNCDHVITVVGFEPFTPVDCPGCGEHYSVPQKLGQFLLFELLGKGGMGAVYRGLDISLKRYVAIKVMRNLVGDETQFVQDFLHEARAVAQFNHRNVVQIYSFGEEHGQPILAMELVAGGSLEDRIEAAEELDEVYILDTAIDVAEALKAGNKLGLCHGDIKPANILFSKKGEAKIVDFGLAWFVESQQMPGEIWGTPYYIAPERVRGKPADHRADMYSFGATFFHALTGHAPFEGDTAKDVVIKRLKNPAPDLRDLRPLVTEATSDVIERTLNVDPGKRYPTYTSLIDDLRRARKTAEQKRSEIDKGTAEIAAKSGDKKYILPITILLLSLLGGASYIWWKPQPPPKKDRKPTRFNLVNGKLVPVANEQLVNRSPKTSQRSQNPPRKRSEHNTATKLTEIVDKVSSGDTLGASIRAHKLYTSLPNRDENKSLVRMIQGLLAWLEGDQKVAETILTPLTDANNETVQKVSRLLLGQSSAEEVWETMGNAPQADQDLTIFSIGIRKLADGDFDEAMEELHKFANQPGDETWTSGFKQFVSAWDRQIAKWVKVKNKLDGQSENYARRQLREFQKTAPWFLKDAARKAEKNLRVKTTSPKKPTAARSRQTIQTTPPRVGASLLLTDMVSNNQSAIDNKDFSRALVNLNQIKDQIKQEPEATEVARLSASYQRLQDLQEFLIRQISVRPPTQPVAELGGTLAGATTKGVKISAGGSESIKAWRDISARLYLKMLDYYVTDTELSSVNRANYLLSLAVYCYIRGGNARAKSYAERAIELNAALSETVKKLLPEYSS